MTLLVQEYLEHKSLVDLGREHGVYHRFAADMRSVGLNYDMIEARPNDPLASECRGVVLGREEPWTTSDVHRPLGRTEVFAFPFSRFFNFGDPLAPEFDWESADLKVLEKVDGTLCIVYFHPFRKEWVVGTRNVPEGDIALYPTGPTFSELFRLAAPSDLFEQLDRELTYCFELTGPVNRVVVAYADSALTLLGVRSTTTLQEHLPPVLRGVRHPEEYSFMDPKRAKEWASAQHPHSMEGVVVRGPGGRDFARMKIKSDAYVTFNRIHDDVRSPRAMLRVVLDGKADDALPLLNPYLKNQMLSIIEGYQGLTRATLDFFQPWEAIPRTAENRKKFAATVDKTVVWAGALFHLWEGGNLPDHIQSAKKEGTWPRAFLDTILRLSRVQEFEVPKVLD